MRRDLVVAGLATALISASALASAPTWLTAIVGIPVLLLAPGHVWSVALFGRTASLEDRSAGASTAERFTITVGLSLGLLVLGGLLLQVTGLPLDRDGWVGLLAVMVAAGIAAAALRERSSSPDRPARRWHWPRFTLAHALLSAAALVMAGAIAVAVVGAITAPQTRFTSLSLSAAPDNQATLNLRNEEGGSRRYLVVIHTSNAAAQQWTVALPDGAVWSHAVTGRPGTTADVYLDDGSGITGPPYRSVALRATGAGR